MHPAPKNRIVLNESNGTEPNCFGDGSALPFLAVLSTPGCIAVVAWLHYDLSSWNTARDIHNMMFNEESTTSSTFSFISIGL